MTNDYHLINRWRLEATAQDIYDLISRPLDFPRWWPAVYLQAEEIAPGDPRGVGRRVRFRTRGRLPYTLLWESQTIESHPPNRLVIRAKGDLEGRGIWVLDQDGGFVNVTFYWKIRAEKPLIRYLSLLLRPVFAANHRWAMEEGRRGLEVELGRRRARGLGRA
jgi:hypothetical protein